ncbi:MAG: AMP-binding protein [Sulfurimonas sp.]|nr:AMP-binding protein [Sulfurimonas sp.]
MNYPYTNLENLTLPSLLNYSVKLYGNQPFSAFVDQEPIKYNEFLQKTQSMAELLQTNGISKGDKVLLLSENMPNWAVAYFATTYFGAVIVPVLTDFHSSDVCTILEHSEAKAVFVSNKHLSTIDKCDKSNIELTVNLDNLEILDKPSKKSVTNKINEKTELNEDDLAAIVYTSGTTGNAKGVMLSHKNLVINAISTFSKAKVLPSDIFLSILPLAHVFECTVGLIVPILNGSSIFYIDKAPTTNVLLEAFKTVRPTMILTVPLIIERIYKKGVLAIINNCIIRKNLYKIAFMRKILNIIAGKKIIKAFGGKIRFFAIGGAPLSPFVEEFLIEANFPYVVGYGLTESAPLIAASVLGKRAKHKSTGTAMAGVELKIKNKNHNTGIGEICVKSPSIMMGYYKDKEKTDEIMEDGWLLTGDLGYLDEDDFLFIVARIKNVIIGSNGENIYPEEIESVINMHGAVLDSMVMQKDSQLIAMIYLDYETCNINNEIDANNFLEKMRNNINSRISSFSRITKFIEQKEPFIKTPTNKIKRYLYADK